MLRTLPCSRPIHADHAGVVQEQSAAQLAETLQSLLSLPQVPQAQPDVALQLLQPMLDASAARLLQLQQQPQAEQTQEQPSGIAQRAWGFLTGILRPAEPASEPAPDALPDALENLQVQLHSSARLAKSAMSVMVACLGLLGPLCPGEASSVCLHLGSLGRCRSSGGCLCGMTCLSLQARLLPSILSALWTMAQLQYDPGEELMQAGARVLAAEASTMAPQASGSGLLADSLHLVCCCALLA